MSTQIWHLAVVAVVAMIGCGDKPQKASPPPGADSANRGPASARARARARARTRTRARAPENAPRRARRRVVKKPVLDPTAHGRLMKASLTGGLGAMAGRRVIRSRFGDPNGCFVAGLSRNVSLGGSVQLRFTLLASGRISGLTLRSTLLDKQVNQCIASRVAEWRFPPWNEGPTRVVYPLRYHRCNHGLVHDAGRGSRKLEDMKPRNVLQSRRN